MGFILEPPTSKGHLKFIYVKQVLHVHVYSGLKDNIFVSTHVTEIDTKCSNRSQRILKDHKSKANCRLHRITPQKPVLRRDWQMASDKDGPVS